MEAKSALQPHERIICALDVPNAATALALVERLREHVGVFKVGLELLMGEGPQIVPQIREAGASKIFVDAKLHDIPNTVAGAVRGLTRLGPWAITLHAWGGRAMLQAASQAAMEVALSHGHTPPLLLGVTVLTSISQNTLSQELHVAVPVAQQVVHLARLAFESGCAGIVASPLELMPLREAFALPPSPLLITPGVRPQGSQSADQARVLSPREAIERGADYLVIGRPLLQAPNPVEVARRIAEEVAEGLSVR